MDSQSVYCSYNVRICGTCESLKSVPIWPKGNRWVELPLVTRLPPTLATHCWRSCDHSTLETSGLEETDWRLQLQRKTADGCGGLTAVRSLQSDLTSKNREKGRKNSRFSLEPEVEILYGLEYVAEREDSNPRYIC